MTIFRQLFDDATSTFTYLIADEQTGSALLIDPVHEQFDRDRLVLEELGLTLKYVLETHVHADHITGGGRLRHELGAEFIVGAGTGLTCADRLIADGETLSMDGITIQAFATPGHTDGCTSYLWQDRLFTGDTILINACGRTDFQQGSAENLYRSIHRLLALPDETLIYPGHDYNGHRVSCVGQEKAINPYVAGIDQPAFVAKMAALNLPKPRRIDVAVPANSLCGGADVARGEGETETAPAKAS
ncbi:MBL fold metallo-hydrolase [Halothiobacillus diazotrophicus]|uniref:MBL fold metallo-hydrolase n=1 Tax=Halothiobacillus diazotrophicus TaxID=1860122 RepID=UPI000A61F2F4|nr:MBL fold metallo-hydrolase [Halothiobacillus diazotrophicus]